MIVQKTRFSFETILFSLLLSTVSMSSALASDHFEKRLFVHKNDTLPYRILLPDGFDPAKKYPVILFLHGRGESGSDNERQLMHGGSLFASDSIRSKFPAVVIFPQCREGGYWANVSRTDHGDGTLSFDFFPHKKPTPQLKLVIQLMTKLRAENWFDKKRFYVGGLSMGGMGTFELLSRKPGWFAAAFPICGGGNPASTKKINPKIPVWSFHGDQDFTVKLAYNEQMINELKKRPAETKFTIYPGVGHNAWDFAFREPELLPWLFSKSK